MCRTIVRAMPLGIERSGSGDGVLLRVVSV